MTFNMKDLLAGMLFTGFGLFFVTNALLSLRVGTANHMGPAFFPVVLGAILILLGIGIALRAFWTGEARPGTVPWRGILLISAAPVAFAVTVRGAGIVPALSLAIGISAFASRRMNPVIAIALILGFSVFCVVVFKYGLGMRFPVLGTWF